MNHYVYMSKHSCLFTMKNLELIARSVCTLKTLWIFLWFDFFY